MAKKRGLILLILVLIALPIVNAKYIGADFSVEVLKNRQIHDNINSGDSKETAELKAEDTMSIQEPELIRSVTVKLWEFKNSFIPEDEKSFVDVIAGWFD